jgi:peptidyl-prolyl cis-trans isomerase C
MTTIPFPFRARHAGLVAAFAVQLLASGCWPGSSDNAAKDSNKMSPMAASAPAPTAAAAASAAPAATATVTANSTGPVVAKVNGIEIRESDIALAEEDIGQQLAQVPPASKRDYLVTYVGDMILLTQAAEAKKLADSNEFKQQLEFARKKLLMARLLDGEAKAASTDAAMRKVFDDAVKQMKPEEEVRARHILVETEDEAKAVKDDLDKGGDFAELAKSKSKDPGAAAEGGDLGFFSKDQMVAEFADAAFKLDKGQTSDPVKSSFGWHIIRVEEKRVKPLPDFEQVKPQLETYVQRKAQTEFLAKLREGAKIERLDKPAEAPAAAPATPAPAEEKK